MAVILICAPTPTAELAPDGKPVFKGPRVAMAVHQSCEFTTIRWAGLEVACLVSRSRASGLGSARAEAGQAIKRGSCHLVLWCCMTLAHLSAARAGFTAALAVSAPTSL